MMFRIARYEDKATYQNHYLGLLWQILNPLIQVGIYYAVFGVGLRAGRNIDSNVPFFVWLLIGIIPWFFISGTIQQAANSIFNKINLVSKMKFPMSILPNITLVSNLTSYGVMMGFLMMILAWKGIYPSLHWIQYIYYFIAMVFFLFSFSILNSTISVLVRDYPLILQSLLRVLFYVSGAIWQLDTSKFPAVVVNILKLNPIVYLLDGFRETFLSEGWVTDHMGYNIYFWVVSFTLLFFGAILHMRFRERFVDFL